LFADQEAKLANIYSSKFNQDLIVDCSAVGAVALAVNSTLIHYPVALASWMLANGAGAKGSYRRVMFVQQLAKVMIAVLLLRKIRDKLKSFGVHQQIGSLLGYGVWSAQLVKIQLSKLLGIDDTENTDPNKREL
jgi:hypothetical protein